MHGYTPSLYTSDANQMLHVPNDWFSAANGWPACSQDTANLPRHLIRQRGSFHSATISIFSLTDSHQFRRPPCPFPTPRPLPAFASLLLVKTQPSSPTTLVASKRPKPSAFLAAPSRLPKIAHEWFHPLSYTAAGQNSARDYLCHRRLAHVRPLKMIDGRIRSSCPFSRITRALCRTWVPTVPTDREVRVTDLAICPV